MNNQELVIQEPPFDKLWQILDDCIQTRRYKQIKNILSDSKDGRCINGVFISYCIGHKDPKSLGYYVDSKDYRKTIKDIVNTVLLPKFKYGLAESDEQYDSIVREKDKNKLIEGLKQDYKTRGIINNSYVAQLNNVGMSFEGIRNLLEEMDV